MAYDYEELINYKYINDFTRSTIPERGGFLGTLQKECYKEGLPVVKPETAKFLEFLCAVKKPRAILEIGTCVGFSSLMISSMCKNAKITTIDRFKFMITRAKENFEKYDSGGNITLLEGQASEILPGLSGPYDMVFLDAAKAQYSAFYPHCVRLLSKGGVFIADNCLVDGIVADESRSTRRDKTTVKRLRLFIDMVLSDNCMQSALLPFGDGVVVGTKMCD